MSDEDGLRVLHVRAARHHGVTGAHRLPNERLSNVENTTGQVTRFLAQVHADERGNLIVTGAASAELTAQRRSGSLDEAALERGVNVFVVGSGHERTGGNICIQASQRVVHVGAFLVAQQANTMQLISVRMRTGDIHVGQPEVEVCRHTQCSQRL